MKLAFSIVGILLVIIWAFKTLEREKKKRNLRTSTQVIEATILDLSCGRRGNIKFWTGTRIFNERIYLSNSECSELSNQQTIGVKIDTDGNVVFANDSYNDWSEAESVAIVLLSLFFIGMITYYGIIPDIGKTGKRKKKKRKRK